MGWSSGDEVFDPVARKLIELGVPDAVKTGVCTVLIGGLQARGWDTESESLGRFAGDPAIVEAFRRNGVTQPCGYECDDGDLCELDPGHDGGIHDSSPEAFDALLDASSLGSPQARAIRALAPPPSERFMRALGEVPGV